MPETPDADPAPTPEFLTRFRALAAPGHALRFDHFMALALYDTEVGYYRRDRKRVGRDRVSDFYTATSSGPVFGELVAAACAKLLPGESLGEFAFVEVGAEPASSVLNGVNHPFRQALTFRLGDELRLPPRAIVFSNELFDAQPFRRFRYAQGGWKESWVNLSGDTLEEVEHDLVTDVPKRLAEVSVPPGYRLDLSYAAQGLLDELVSGAWEGLFLAFDYGHTWESLVTEYPAGTARAYHRHRQTNQLLARPGEQDLTSHVCWDFLTESLLHHGFHKPLLQSQEAFFMHHAGDYLATVIAADAAKFSARKMALMQLLHPGNMGQKFQVLSARRRSAQ
jgi:SAM-dependent MidA family methyltransferase